jgi:predicted RNA-binding protein with PIN domain
MRFLIDGYNLLHAIWPSEARRVRPQAWPRFRQRLIDHLRDKLADEADVATVIFDATRAPPEAASEVASNGLHVRFAAGYPSADDLIEELIRTDSAPAQLTVVSDDRRIREAARRRGCTIAGCLDFYEGLENLPRSKPLPVEPPSKPAPESLSSSEVKRWLEEFGVSGNDV